MRERISVRQEVIWGLLIVGVAVVVGTALWSRYRNSFRGDAGPGRELEGLGIFGQVPDFSLVERSGRRLGLSDLSEKVWLVNFIYTHCQDTCPVQSAQMRELQDEFSGEKNLRLVSITVDPGRDSPEVLSEYAGRFHADPQRWFFLTGERDAIYRLAQEGFHLGAAEIPLQKRDGSGATHVHSPRVVLVDGKARIRGYYPSTDRGAMGRLRGDLRTLLRETR